MRSSALPIRFHNTLGNTMQEFQLAAHAKSVRMYNCGPTVYGPQHIGNLSMFVFTDVLRRVLEYNGLSVKQVINFTDVGHLTSDEDEGEDKMMKGLKREGLKPTLENMRALGEKYATLFLEDLKKLNIDAEHITFPRASDYIAAQIAMVKTLEEKGYAYRGGGGVYFDTSRFPDYGKLGNIDLSGLKEGARVARSGEKRHPTDFLLWKLSNRMGWDSPWGKGFPGWHIECSAMIRATLGAHSHPPQQ
jgi:cysteinyl-tRNA synthetase